MPLETAAYISGLDATAPAHTDQINQADGHLRLIKGVLKSSFPNVDGAVTATAAELEAVAKTGQVAAQDGASGSPSLTFKNDATTGFYKGARTGQTAISGTLRGSGAYPVGGYMDFPKVPARFTSGGTAAGGAAAIDWIECDGSLYNVPDFPDLGAFLGNTYGGDGVNTFGVPNLTDTNRFRRARSATLTVGTKQANAFKSHIHTLTEDTQGGHSHNITIHDPGHSHTTTPSSGEVLNRNAGGPIAWNNGSQSIADLSINSATTGIWATSDFVAGHVHNPTVVANSDGGSTETRPESIAAVVCLKT